MDWDDLKHFLAVARSGSLTDAALSLKAGAATVSRHIYSLELRLDARLFEHRSTGYVLTDVGRAIFMRAQEVEAAVQSLEREVFSKDLKLTGKVRVATTEDMASMVVIPNLAPFVAEYPGIQLELLGAVATASLTRRDADIALRSSRPDTGDLLVRRIGGVDLGLYAARIYAEARGLTEANFDFAKVETITWVEEMANFRGGQWLAANSSESTATLHVNTTRLLYSACVSGLGVAILPCFGADLDPALICLVPPERIQTSDLWLVVHRDLAGVPRIRAVMRFLSDLGPKFARRPQ